MLKSVKCALMISGVELSEELVFDVKNWLVVHVPDFAEFKICSSSKYPGWHLGVNSNEISEQDPLANFGKRVIDISDGKAPSTIAMLGYNGRALPVLSFVAQFAVPPATLKVCTKE